MSEIEIVRNLVSPAMFGTGGAAGSGAGRLKGIGCGSGSGTGAIGEMTEDSDATGAV